MTEKEFYCIVPPVVMAEIIKQVCTGAITRATAREIIDDVMRINSSG